MNDPYDLRRFVDAQDAGGTFERAVAELSAGRKRTHWMWFVFPQVAGLGQSSTARRFAIGSLDEARAYFGHSLLGPRLLRAISALQETDARSADEILGAVDAMKLRSSMTLFEAASPEIAEFAQMLDQFFDGQPDPLTLERLSDRH